MSDSDADEYVYYGTPLEQQQTCSYYASRQAPKQAGQVVALPVHQQEVRDAQGRQRLHGAFTGGFSAGFFNTVGSEACSTQRHVLLRGHRGSRVPDGAPAERFKPAQSLSARTSRLKSSMLSTVPLRLHRSAQHAVVLPMNSCGARVPMYLHASMLHCCRKASNLPPSLLPARIGRVSSNRTYPTS